MRWHSSAFPKDHVDSFAMLMTLWMLAEEAFQSWSTGFILWHVTAESDKEMESLKTELEALKKQFEGQSPVCAFIKNKAEAR